MFLLPEFSVKSPFDADPGELLVIELRKHRAVGIVLAKDQRQTLFGLIATSENETAAKAPFAFNLDRQYHSGKECLSYGSDWVLELEAGVESFPGNREECWSAGVIYLTSDGPNIYFPSLGENSLGEGYTFNLATNSLVDNSDRGTPHLAWRIWAKQSDSIRTGGRPVVTFQARTRTH